MNRKVIFVLFIILLMLNCARKVTFIPEFPVIGDSLQIINVFEILDTFEMMIDSLDPPAVILNEEVTLINNEENCWENIHRVIWIRKPEGISYGNVKIQLESDEIIDTLYARTILPDGKILYFSGDSATTGDIWSKQFIFSFPSVETNCVIEYLVRIESDNPRLFGSFTFGDEIPIRHSLFSLISPEDWIYEIYKKDVIELNEEIEGKWIKLIWEVYNQTQYKEEISGPDPLNFAPRVDYVLSRNKDGVVFEDWLSLVSYLFDELKPRFKLENSVILSLKSRIKENIGINEQLEIIKDFILRRVKLEPYASAFVPDSAMKTWSRGWGTEGDLAILFIALGRSLGLSVYPALFREGLDGKVFSDIPNPAYFTKWLIWVSSEEPVFIDPGYLASPIGKLPYMDYGGEGIILFDDPEVFFEKFQIGNEEIFGITRKELIASLDKEGNIFVDGRIVFEEQNAIILRELLGGLNEDQTFYFFADYLKKWNERSVLRYLSVENYYELQKPLIIEIKFEIPFYSSILEDRVIFRLNILTRERLENEWKSTKRNYQLFTYFTQIEVDDVAFFGPDEYKVEDFPDSINYENENFTYISYCTSRDSVLFYHREFVRNQGVIEPGDFILNKDFLIKIAQFDKSEASFRKRL